MPCIEICNLLGLTCSPRISMELRLGMVSVNKSLIGHFKGSNITSLFAHRMFYNKIPPNTPKHGNGSVLLKRVYKFIGLLWITVIWASARENLSSGVREQHRNRSACASAQSDQCLCYSLFEKCHM